MTKVLVICSLFAFLATSCGDGRVRFERVTGPQGPAGVDGISPESIPGVSGQNGVDGISPEPCFVEAGAPGCLEITCPTSSETICAPTPLPTPTPKPCKPHHKHCK